MAYELELRSRGAEQPADTATPRVPVEDVGSGPSPAPARRPEWLRIELIGVEIEYWRRLRRSRGAKRVEEDALRQDPPVRASADRDPFPAPAADRDRELEQLFPRPDLEP